MNAGPPTTAPPLRILRERLEGNEPIQVVAASDNLTNPIYKLRPMLKPHGGDCRRLMEEVLEDKPHEQHSPGKRDRGRCQRGAPQVVAFPVDKIRFSQDAVSCSFRNGLSFHRGTVGFSFHRTTFGFRFHRGTYASFSATYTLLSRAWW